MNGLMVIFKKELKDSLRDRRALLTAMLPAVFGPVLMMTLLSSAAETRKEVKDLELPVIGQEYAPDLIAYLADNGMVIETFEGDPKTAIQDRTADVILEISAEYGEAFAAFEPASLFLYGDDSLEKSEQASERVARMIRDYSRGIGSMRLMIRGVNPRIASPIDLDFKDYSTRASRASKVLASLQMFLLMAAFFGGAGVAIDTTAGEREHNSLEPLLVHPLTSSVIMGGKWLTVALYGTLATLVVVVSTALCLEYISLEALGVDPKLPLDMQVRIFALLLPMALFAAAAQMLASLFAKTFKEAQTYLGLLTMLPILPVMFTMFKDIKTASWMYLVPIMGQQQLITSVMRGEGMELAGFATSVAVTSAAALLLFAILTRLLRSERVVYGG